MSTLESLPIPAPQAVREMLARNERERALLRSLYRLSCRAVEEQQAHARAYGRPAANSEREAQVPAACA